MSVGRKVVVAYGDASYKPAADAIISALGADAADVKADLSDAELFETLSKIDGSVAPKEGKQLYIVVDSHGIGAACKINANVVKARAAACAIRAATTDANSSDMTS